MTAAQSRRTGAFALLGGVLGLLAVLAGGAPAQAHSQLVSTEPARGATVTAPIESLRMTFNEPVLARFSAIVVTGPGGAIYSTAHLTRVDDVVTQALQPTRSGAYTVKWRVVSADGHPVGGTWQFHVALSPGAGPPQPSPVAARQRPAGDQQAGRTHTLVWLVWLVAAAAVATVGAAIWRRSRQPR
jgi:methionine-rich copper-binding protein CopC